jgi:nicotinamide-nucleotide amidase
LQSDLICVGNELLTGLIENSNTGFLARRLWSAGIPVRETCVVADEKDAIRTALERALKVSELIILTGGLGPTDDDLTREAVAEALNLPLVENRQWLDRLEQFFNDRGINMPESNRKQALCIEGSILLENSRGTAPGLMIEKEKKIIVLLPGPPQELELMFDQKVLPVLTKNIHGSLTKVKTLKVFGIGESMLEEKIKELGRRNLSKISYVARGYEVDLQIKGSGNLAETNNIIEQAEKDLRNLLGDYIFGSDDETLAGLMAELLVKNKKTLALAESCSGGALSDQITDIAGSSKFYRGGIVAYSRSAKENLLGIESDLLDREGEVSEAVAILMADSIKNLFKTDIGVGITGIAGPDSDSSGSPVGLVFIAIASDQNNICRMFKLIGGRHAIKERASQIALYMVKKLLSNKYL